MEEGYIYEWKDARTDGCGRIVWMEGRVSLDGRMEGRKEGRKGRSLNGKTEA